MKPLGINRNAALKDMPSGSQTTARNVVFRDEYSNTTNEGGFHVGMYLPDGYVVCGYRELPERFIVFSTNGTISRIGIYEIDQEPDISTNAEVIFNDLDTILVSSYIPILATQYLNFSIDYPIQCEYTILANGDMVIIWIAGNDTPKILNIDDLPFSVTGTLELITPSDARLMEFSPDIPIPEVFVSAFDSIQSRGALNSGAYHVCIQYKLADGVYSRWIIATNPIYIHPGSKNEEWFLYDGGSIESPANKSISVTISGLTGGYEKIRVGIVSIVNNFTKCVILGEYAIAPTVKIIYSGAEVVEEVPFESFFEATLLFNRLGTLKVFNSHLYVGDVKLDAPIKYQKHANNIEVKWTYNKESTVALDGTFGSFKDGAVSFANKGFMPGEVYALYFRWILTNGDRSDAFHIPGRDANPGDTAELDSATYPEAHIISESPKKYQFLDTCTDETPADLKGDMSYWENETEFYPTEGEEGADEFDGQHDYNGAYMSGRDLRGTAVKHHRFPSLNYLESLSSQILDNPDGIQYSSIHSHTAYLNVDNFPDGYMGFEYGIISPPGGEYLVRPVPYSTIKNIKFLAIEDCDISIEVSVGAYIKPYELEPNTELRVRLKIERWDKYDILQDTLYDSGNVYTFEYTNLFYDYDTLNKGDYILVKLVIHNTTGASSFNEEDGPWVNLLGANPCIVNIRTYQPSGKNSATMYSRVLGLHLSNIVVPQEIANKVKGYEILYAKRDFNNSYVIAQGTIVPHDDRNIRFAAFDLLANKPSFSPSHLFRELKYSDLVCDAESSVTKILSNNLIEINRGKYIPTNDDVIQIIDDNSNTSTNVFREETVLLTGSSETVISILLGLWTSNNDYYELATLYSYKPDMYMPYSSQNLAIAYTGKIGITNSIGNVRIMGGDTYVNLFGITTYYYDAAPSNEWEKYKIRYYMLPCSSIGNIGLRAYDETDNRTVYFPRVNLLADQAGPNPSFNKTYLPSYPDGTPDPDTIWGKIAGANVYSYIYELDPSYLYNTDFSRVHDILPFTLFNFELEYIIEYPNRFYRSVIQEGVSTRVTYSTFLPLDYKDVPVEKGKIFKLSSDGRDLLVHCKYSLYFLKYSDSFEVDELGTIALGSPDMLNSRPEEVFYTRDGYVGLKSKWGVIETKFGVFIVDAINGRLFMYANRSIKELADKEMSRFLLSKLKYISDIDNPFKDIGICVGYDYELKRLLITKRYIDGNNNYSFTLSYYPEIDKIKSFHDYIPNGYLSNRKGLYSILNDHDNIGMGGTYPALIYKHNASNKYGKFYGNQLHESYVDILFNIGQNAILEHINIKTLVENLTNIEEIEKTITGILVYTQSQHSGIIQLTPGATPTGNIRRMFDRWRFNSFRDILKNKSIETIDYLSEEFLQFETVVDPQTDWWKKSLFIGGYFVVRVKIDNIDQDLVRVIDIEPFVKLIKQ